MIVDRNPITPSMLRALLEAGRDGGVRRIDRRGGRRIARGGVARLLIDEATARAGENWLAELARSAVAARRQRAYGVVMVGDLHADERERIAGDAASTKSSSNPIAGPALRDKLYPVIATNREKDAIPTLFRDAA